MARFTLPALLFAGFLALTACASEEERLAEQVRLDKLDHEECLRLGFEPGSDSYGNCRLQLKKIRAEGQYSREPNVGFGVGVGIGL